METIKSIFYYILAGLFEIGGGYLIWLWLREGKSIWYGLAGAIVLILYGIVPTLQPVNANFGDYVLPEKLIAENQKQYGHLQFYRYHRSQPVVNPAVTKNK
jgi:hypothetical protein